MTTRVLTLVGHERREDNIRLFQSDQVEGGQGGKMLIHKTFVEVSESSFEIKSFNHHHTQTLTSLLFKLWQRTQQKHNSNRKKLNTGTFNSLCDGQQGQTVFVVFLIYRTCCKMLTWRSKLHFSELFAVTMLVSLFYMCSYFIECYGLKLHW